VLLSVHRWTGLTLLPVIAVIGLTGALLPFAGELNRMIAPSLWDAAPPTPDARLLDGIELADRVERQTGGIASYVRLSLATDRAQAIFIEPHPDGPALNCNEAIADPYTGVVRRCLRYGDLSEGAVSLVPFLVRLHYSFGAGSWGILLFGVAALVWGATSLAGLWLTFYRRAAPGVAGAAAWTRSRHPFWRVRRHQGMVIFVHDLHRAVGVSLLPVLLLFMWSGVAFNLQPVHAPVQKLFGAQGVYQPLANPDAGEGPAMTRIEALKRGQQLMAEMARQKRFDVLEPYAISWDAAAHAAGYYALTSLDGPTKRASTAVWFDRSNGRLLAFRAPYGDTKADAVDKASRMLHTAALFGWPYRVFVSLVGLACAAMTIAGGLLWLKRSDKRLRTSSPGRSR